MSEMYNDYDVKKAESTEDIRKKNKEYLNSIKKEIQKNTKTNELKEMELFNLQKSFIIDFIGYFSLLLLGVFINVIIISADIHVVIQLVLSGITTVVICAMLYYWGYIRAKKKIGIKKYSPIICILLVFIVVIVLSLIFGLFGHDFILAKAFRYARNLFVYSHQVIFTWLSYTYNFVIIPYIEVLVTLLFMTLGIRHSIIKEKNSK